MTHSQGRLLAALEHDGVPGGQGRSQLVADKDEGHIPGDDGGHDAEGLLERVADKAARVEAGGSLGLVAEHSVVAEGAGGGCRLKVGAHGPAHRQGLEACQLGVRGHQLVSQSLHEDTALGRRQRAPGRERGLCSRHSRVDVAPGGFVDCGRFTGCACQGRIAGVTDHQQPLPAWLGSAERMSCCCLWRTTPQTFCGQVAIRKRYFSTREHSVRHSIPCH